MSCDSMELHGSVTVGAKGQVVIPKEVRTQLQINEGDKLMVMTKGNMAVGFIKADDMKRMLEHLNQELDKNKA